MNNTPANWYPDPTDPALLRYWDGETWTEHTAPATGTAAQPTGAAATQPSTSGASAPNPWLWQSIVATLLCCLPLGVAGIVYASRSQTAWASGDAAGAQQAAKTAKTLTLVSIAAVPVTFIAVWVVLLGGALSV